MVTHPVKIPFKQREMIKKVSKEEWVRMVGEILTSEPYQVPMNSLLLKPDWVYDKFYADNSTPEYAAFHIYWYE
jgi:hypothetical protein